MNGKSRKEHDSASSCINPHQEKLIRKNFGEIVRIERGRRKWSIDNLAEEAELDSRTISKVEKGLPHRASTDECICEVLKISPRLALSQEEQEKYFQYLESVIDSSDENQIESFSQERKDSVRKADVVEHEGNFTTLGETLKKKSEKYPKSKFRFTVIISPVLRFFAFVIGILFSKSKTAEAAIGATTSVVKYSKAYAIIGYSVAAIIIVFIGGAAIGIFNICKEFSSFESAPNDTVQPSSSAPYRNISEQKISKAREPKPVNNGRWNPPKAINDIPDISLSSYWSFNVNNNHIDLMLQLINLSDSAVTVYEMAHDSATMNCSVINGLASADHYYNCAFNRRLKGCELSPGNRFNCNCQISDFDSSPTIKVVTLGKTITKEFPQISETSMKCLFADPIELFDRFKEHDLEKIRTEQFGKLYKFELNFYDGTKRQFILRAMPDIIVPYTNNQKIDEVSFPLYVSSRWPQKWMVSSLRTNTIIISYFIESKFLRFIRL